MDSARQGMRTAEASGPLSLAGRTVNGCLQEPFLSQEKKQVWGGSEFSLGVLMEWGPASLKGGRPGCDLGEEGAPSPHPY